MSKVPAGWEATSFENHIELLSGFTFKSEQYTSNEEDIRLLRGDNIEPGSLRWRNAKRWPLEEFPLLERYQLREGDFVIAMDRTWVSSGLKVAEVEACDLPCLLVQRVSRIRANKTLAQSLLRQYFSGKKFEDYVKSVQTETAVPHISSQQIKEFSLLLPPLPEQTKIAQILSTWDKAIATTEQLVGNSQQQKKALMQSLLTGRKRLPGFEGEWSETTLGEVSRPQQWPTITSNQLSHSGFRVFGANGFIGYYSEYNHEFECVTVTCRGSTCGEVSLIPEMAYITGNSMCLDDINPLINSYRYLYYALSYRGFNDVISGSAQPQIVGAAIKKIKINLPPLPEQQKIAAVLTVADNEIELLQKKLAFLKQEKTALMQQLLTGKRRVKVEAA